MALNPSKIFYGWWVVGACALISLITGGFVILNFTAFIQPIAAEFGWSYAMISLAASLRGLETGIFSPLLGLIFERVGPRKLLLIGITLTGLGFILLSRVQSLGMFYAAYGLVALGTSGTSPAVVMPAVSNWFRKKVGIAIGVLSSGFACGSLLVPVAVILIDTQGWREAVLILGICEILLGIPLSLLVKHKPEQYGLLPDGDLVMPREYGVYISKSESTMNTAQVLKKRAFWQLAVAVSLPFVANSGVVVHIMPFLSSVDISRSLAGIIVTALALMSIVGRLGCGWLTDKFNPRMVSIIFLFVLCAGLVMLIYSTSQLIWLVIPFVISFGIGYGGSATIRAALLVDYFGRQNFGKVFGFAMGLMSLCSLAGPLLAGWVWDAWKNYQGAWFGFIGLCLIAILVLITTPPARPKPIDKT